MEKAGRLGREGTEKERMKAVGALLRSGEDIAVEYTYNSALLDEKLAEVAEEFDREAEDSKITRANGAFDITEEKEGRTMRRAETARLSAAVLETQESGRAAIAADVTQPDVTYEDNQNVTDLIGSFSTEIITLRWAAGISMGRFLRRERYSLPMKGWGNRLPPAAIKMLPYTTTARLSRAWRAASAR